MIGISVFGIEPANTSGDRPYDFTGDRPYDFKKPGGQDHGFSRIHTNACNRRLPNTSRDRFEWRCFKRLSYIGFDAGSR